MPKRTEPDAASLPASAPRRAEEIRASLQAEIENGELEPGSQLDEKALTERFMVSRTPVREALQQLAALDLVTMRPRQGVTVSRLSVNKVRSMLEFISEVEGVLATLAARRMSPDAEAGLRACLGACHDALQRQDAGAYAAANAEFHDWIYRAARNAHMVAMLKSTRRMIKRYRFSPLFTARQMAISYADHQKIAEAILAGNESAAALAAKGHVPYGNTGFAEFLALVPGKYLSEGEGEGEGESESEER